MCACVFGWVGRAGFCATTLTARLACCFTQRTHHVHVQARLHTRTRTRPPPRPPPPQEDRSGGGGAVGPSLVRRCDDVLARCGVMASTRPRAMFSAKHLAGDLAKLVKVRAGRGGGACCDVGCGGQKWGVGRRRVLQ